MAEQHSDDTDEGEQQELAKALQSDSDDCISDDGIKDCLLDDAPISASSLNPGDYILVAVHGKKSTQHFVAHVAEVASDENLLSKLHDKKRKELLSSKH